MFAYQHYGVKPDVMTLAKPLASGLPLGAILVTADVASAIHPGMHGTTFGGGPLSCAVALEVLKVIEDEKILAHVKEVGGYFLDLLRQLDARHGCIVDVRGAGLMVGVELDSADLAKAVLKAMMEQKIIINRTHETVLRFLPPYVVTKKQVEVVVKALDQILSSCASSGDAAPATKRSPRQRLPKACSERREMKSPDFDPELDIQEDQAMATRSVEKNSVDNKAANDAPAAPVLTDLTAMSDLTPAEAHGLLELAALVKARPADFRTALAGKQIVLFFEKPSFRTRLTFESGIYSLGGHAMFVDQLTSRIGEREPVSDMAHNLERWVDALVLRTFSHAR